MGALRKYFLPVMRVGPTILFNYGKMRRYAKHRDEIPYEKRYEFACKFFKGVVKAFRVQINAEGLEKIESSDALIVCNHQSFFDVFLMTLFDFPICWVAKKEVEKYPFVKHVAKLMDVIFLDRADLRSSINIIKEATKRLESGKSMWINPEGKRTTNENNEMNPFKAGSFKTVLSAKKNIILCAVNNSQHVFSKTYMKKPLVVDFAVIEEWKYEDFQDLNTTEIAQICHDKIEAKFKEFQQKDAQ